MEAAILPLQCLQYHGLSMTLCIYAETEDFSSIKLFWGRYIIFYLQIPEILMKFKSTESA